MSKIKGKERILRTAREKQPVAYKGSLIKLSADFSAETLKTREVWHDTCKILRGKKNFKPQISN